jgi:hypothetical protein
MIARIFTLAATSRLSALTVPHARAVAGSMKGLAIMHRLILEVALHDQADEAAEHRMSITVAAISATARTARPIFPSVCSRNTVVLHQTDEKPRTVDARPSNGLPALYRALNAEFSVRPANIGCLR